MFIVSAFAAKPVPLNEIGALEASTTSPRTANRPVPNIPSATCPP